MSKVLKPYIFLRLALPHSLRVKKQKQVGVRKSVLKTGGEKTIFHERKQKAFETGDKVCILMWNI
jgi:hypothetical protein